MWAITIEPDGHDDVTIKLVAGADDKCGSGLACTTDMRPLSEELLHTVKGLDAIDEVVQERVPNFDTPITAKPTVVIHEKCKGANGKKKNNHHYHTRGTLTVPVDNADYYELRVKLWGDDEPWTIKPTSGPHPFNKGPIPMLIFDLRFKDNPSVGHLKCGIGIHVQFRAVNNSGNNVGPWSDDTFIWADEEDA